MQLGIYQHYKGGFYLLLGVAAHSETDEKLAIYVSLTTSLSGPRMRARPLWMWTSPVTWPDGSMNTRFKYIGNEMPK